MTFTVTHLGRGGHVTCRWDAGELELPLEMGGGGGFSVWLRGARLLTASGTRRPLRAVERELVVARLRQWLEETERSSWVVEV